MIAFEVPGTPIGKGRPRVTTIGGHARMYTPTKTAHYEHQVAAAARYAMGGLLPIAGAVRVTVFAYLPIPVSWSKRKQLAAAAFQLLPTSKPDLDNVCKAVLDGINGICFVDDAQVVALETGKWFGAEPRVTVVVDRIKIYGEIE